MDSPSRRRRLSPSQRRAEILDRGVEVAFESGLHTVTMKGIARDLGITPGLVNHYFESIDGLLAEIFAVVNSKFRTGPMPQASPVAALAAQLRDHLSPATRSVSRVWMEAVYASATSPILRQAVIAEIQTGREELAALIERIDAPRPAERSALDIATTLLALVDGYLLQVWLGDPHLEDEIAATVLQAAEVELGLPLGSLARETQ